jgi:wobble nucleotide-excising tRNase
MGLLMISDIKIKDIASYDISGIELSNLKQINFIYGQNGSGKTTISELILNEARFPKSEIVWKEKLQPLVYNQKFVEENFKQREEIKGIFTLGKESVDIRNSIEENKSLIEKNQGKVGKLKIHLEQQGIDKEKNELRYEEACWSLKKEYDEPFKEAFEGFRSSKANFKDKCIKEAGNTEPLKLFYELINQNQTIFNSPKQRVNKIDLIVGDMTIELDPILQIKIIGKEDVNISKLISKLNISDWVRKGYEHLEHTVGICPFCQEPMSEILIKEFEEYFDYKYIEQIKLINAVDSEYRKQIDFTLNQINMLIQSNSFFLDINEILKHYTLIESKYNANKTKLEKKIKEPSRSITLDSIAVELELIELETKKGNAKIDEHNRVVNNIDKEKKNLITGIWKFIAAKNEREYKSYAAMNQEFNRALQGIKNAKKQKEDIIKSLELENQRLEIQITSVLPSINEINKLLISFGFTNFMICESATIGNYLIVRDNGEDAKNTLSEGEKTFLTFLYFYQLLKGSNSKSGISDNKIVIFDDPISSLDSNVLFVVSSLIREIIENIRNNNSNIKQLFLLTHNVYFHKEVSFNKGNGTQKRSDETFWLLRKINNISSIQYYESNPIKTSYELLWNELKILEEDNSITIHNVMRRILENYFKILGNLNDEDIIKKFEPDNQSVCKSLLSWINDGSHYISDDLFIQWGSDTAQRYSSVFKEIFKVSGHEAHYNMMMAV